MKHHCFIKFDPRVKRLTGCDRATLILEKIEFFFSKQPNGFYKFIEPCSHRLYKKFDSWSEELGCDRKSFTRAWEKIAFRHKSRRAFNEARDKFEGHLYASFYDRNKNQMFFIRNHELANETLKDFYKPKKSKIKKEDTQAKKTPDSLASEPLRNGHSGRSDKDVKKTPSELFENNSHAGSDIIKKMIEIWTAIVQEGRGEIDLKGKIIPFLKKALSDKFNNCLKKWKDYCTNIARSKYLMGEKNSWKADLEWALKFESIRKVLSGKYYGIGDRTPKSILPSQAEIHEEITVSDETQEIKDFRTLCLKTVGIAKYICQFRNLKIEFREEGEISLIAAHKFGADFLEKDCYSYLRLILQASGEGLKRISILAPGEKRGRLVEREKGGDVGRNLHLVSEHDQPTPEEILMEEEDAEDESLPEISPETKALKEKLRIIIPPHQFPSWLNSIEVGNIGENDVLSITLADSFAVNYCQLRFSQEILQSAKILWDDVKSVVFHEKERISDLPSIENSPQKSEVTQEQSKLEQIILGLRAPFTPRLMETLGI